MKIEVLSQKNEKSGTIELPDNIFKVKWNQDLVHQALVAQAANERKVYAHTKGRGDVRGGGKKPWAQKHTGRSRQSSIRSPLWAGGGVTFGPTKERNFSKKINKKMKRQAVFSLLSRKLSENEVLVLDSLEFETPKTKNVSSMIKGFFKSMPSVLIVPKQGSAKTYMAARNLPKVKVLSPEAINVYDCLSHQYVFFDKEGIMDFVKHVSKSE